MNPVARADARRRGRLVRGALAAAALHGALAGPASAEDRTTPGDASVEPPTLISLGIDWPIQGDDNRNASVEVDYRRVGEATWHRALPLLRLQNEQVNGRVGGPSFREAALARAVFPGSDAIRPLEHLTA